MGGIVGGLLLFRLLGIPNAAGLQFPLTHSSPAPSSLTLLSGVTVKLFNKCSRGMGQEGGMGSEERLLVLRYQGQGG